MATLKDIARASGVSTATVSYVVNNGPREVSPATRERVERAIRELNYRPSAAARGLKGKRTDTFGVIFPHVVAAPLENAYFGPVLAGILDTATNRKSACMLFTGFSWDEAESNLSLYTDGRCDGLLLIAAPKTTLLVPALLDSGIPFVLVGTHYFGRDATSVDVDNVLGARLATQHLLDLGHRKIGMLQGSAHQSSNDERTEGFLAAFETRGVRADPTLIQPAAYQEDRARESALKLLSRRDRPTAIFCANDVLAIKAMETARHLRIRVPEQLSVVGFDDYSFAASAEPPLTTIRHPLREIGARAAELLLVRVHDRRKLHHERVILKPSLVIRESTAPPA